ncbi:MAG: tetratricopeptide repeat protein [Chitinophagales bacterium]|nr:tetratricopeptide repeat protein [Chitinophagales bacterium]
MRILSSIAFLLCLSISLFAQSGKYNTAVFSLEEYQNSQYKETDALLEALEAINSTALDAEWALKPKVWFLKAKINDYIYQDSILSNQQTKAPFDAAEGYRKSLSFPNEKFNDAKLAKEMLFILATRMYNTGVVLIQAKDDDNANKYFEEVRNAKKFLDSIGYTKEMEEKNRNIFEQTERDATYNAAICLLRLDKKEEAKVIMQELMDRNYDSPDIYRIVSNYNLEAGDTTKALEILDKAIARYPEDINLLVSKLNVFIAQKKSEQALAMIEKAVQLDPKNTDILFVLGDAYAKAGKEAESEQTYLKIAEIDPQGDNAFKAYNNLGAMYIDQGNTLNKRLLDDSKLSEKQYEEITAQRNVIYAKAIPHLEKALAIKSNDKQILRVLKEVYAKLGQYDKSKQMKEQLEQLGG